MASDGPNLECRMYKAKYPEVDMAVMIQVKVIADMGAYVSLLEYNNTEGYSKDRMFITKTKWATEWGGAKSKETGAPFKRMPFYCCALTFTPFEDPVCTADGSVFNVMHITPYIRKYGRTRSMELHLN